MESDKEDPKTSTSLFEYAIKSFSKQLSDDKTAFSFSSSQSSSSPPSSSSVSVDTRLLLQGPTQCGKTSLLMDVAYNIAKNEMCSNENGGDIDCNSNENRACTDDCPIVTFLVPTKNKSNTSFPLICSPLEHPEAKENQKEPLLDDDDIIDDDEDDSIINQSSSMLELKRREQQFKRDMDGLDNELAKVAAGEVLVNTRGTDATGKRKRRNTPPPLSRPLHHKQHHHNNWNTKEHSTILKKIRVQYVDSVLDLMNFLASMPMHISPSSSHCRAIIIDDLDYFVRDHDLSITGMGDVDGSNHDEMDNEDTHELEDGYARRSVNYQHDYSSFSRASISKNLFRDDHNHDNDFDEQSRTKSSNGNSLSTIEMMRLVQLCKYKYKITFSMQFHSQIKS